MMGNKKLTICEKTFNLVEKKRTALVKVMKTKLVIIECSVKRFLKNQDNRYNTAPLFI